MLSNKKAFTLIELLVVVLIIGILAAVAVPQYRLAVEKSHIVEAIANLKAVVSAEQIYYLTNGKYTTNWDNLDIEIPKTGMGELQSNALDQKYYYFVINTVESDVPRVYVGRKGGGISAGHGRWYISYIFKTGQMYCSAYGVDANAMKVCKTFGEEVSCPVSDHSLHCYKIH